jgi:hypothetical protein
MCYVRGGRERWKTRWRTRWKGKMEDEVEDEMEEETKGNAQIQKCIAIEEKELNVSIIEDLPSSWLKRADWVDEGDEVGVVVGMEDGEMG